MNKSVVCCGGSILDKERFFRCPPPLCLICGHTAAVHKRQEAVSDTSEYHEGPGQHRMHPTSPKMSSLPILHLLLLLLTAHAPQAQGRSLPRRSTEEYNNMIKEITRILYELPLPPPVSSCDKVGTGWGQAGRCHSPAGLMGFLSLFLYRNPWT